MSFRKFIKKEEFFHLYQPIYNLNDWTIIGNEGLIRSKKYHSPEETFNLAKTIKRLYELDIRSLLKAILTYQNEGFSRIDGKLFLNVFPSTIQRSSFQTFIKFVMDDLQIPSQQIVLEINESERIRDLSQFSKITRNLKKNGILIALDDIGRGISDFQKIIELEPDYIKVDRYFSDKLSHSNKKQALVQSLIKYCDDIQAKLILEGLETPIDLACAKIIGVPYGQGYILGKPRFLEKTV